MWMYLQLLVIALYSKDTLTLTPSGMVSFPAKQVVTPRRTMARTFMLRSEAVLDTNYKVVEILINTNYKRHFINDNKACSILKSEGRT